MASCQNARPRVRSPTIPLYARRITLVLRTYVRPRSDARIGDAPRRGILHGASAPRPSGRRRVERCLRPARDPGSLSQPRAETRPPGGGSTATVSEALGATSPSRRIAEQTDSSKLSMLVVGWNRRTCIPSAALRLPGTSVSAVAKANRPSRLDWLGTNHNRS